MGTTAEKLTYLNTTKTKIKDAINLANTSITNETFRLYEEKIKQAIINTMLDKWKVWDNFDKVTGSGTDLTLNNTHKAPLKLDLNENTYQTKTTQGKNLFDSLKGENGYVDNNGDVVYRTIQFASDYIKIENNVNYTISANRSVNTIGVAYFDSNKDIILPRVDNNNVSSAVANSSTAAYIRFWVNVDGVTAVNATSIANTFNVQLEKSSSATSYEPFVPDSPSPNYPQDIHLVSGDNTINICGKNLYSRNNGEYNVPVYATDGTSASYQDVNVVWVKAKPNTDYSFTLLPNSKNYFVRIIECTGDKGFIYRFPINYQPGSGVANTLTITTPNNCEWLQIGINQNQASQISQNNWGVMIEESSTPTTYEEYKGPSYPISLGYTNMLDMSTLINDKGLNTTNGKDLYDASGYSVSPYIKIRQNVDYSITNDSNNTATRIYYYDEYKNFLSTERPITSFNSTTATYIRLQDNTSNFEDGYVIKETGVTPIEYCGIGDYKNKFIRTSGKNLFNILTITENTYIEENGNTGSSQVTNLSDYIEVKSNTKYTLSYDYSTLLNSNQRNIIYYDENKTYISGWIYLPTNKTNTFTTPSNAKYLRFSYDKSCYEIQLENNLAATSYEPFGNNEWYFKKAINKLVLDGVTNPLYGDGGSDQNYWEYSRTGITGGIGTQASVLTNYFNQTTNSRIVILSNGGLYFRFPKNAGIDVSTNTLLNSWLETHNTIVDYVLATPTYTKITDYTLLSQLEAIYNAISMQGVTNILQENNDLPFNIDATALEVI